MMVSLISLVIIVSGIVFGTTLLGDIAYEKYKEWIKVENITCDCMSDIESGVYPWQVSLGKLSINKQLSSDLNSERLGLETHLCGGVLVNPKYVLVSAHCVRFNYDQKLGVGFGSGDLLAIYNKGRIPIKKIIYDSNNQIDDIALLELENEINFKSESLAKPACFNRLNGQIDEYNVDLTATGWNLIEKKFSDKDYFTVKRYHGQNKFKDVSTQDKNCDKTIRICARAKESKNCACYTDTGSPLHLFNHSNLTTVVGIHQIYKEISNITVGCPEIYFTRISTKLDFIQTIVKDQICLI